MSLKFIDTKSIDVDELVKDTKNVIEMFEDAINRCNLLDISDAAFHSAKNLGLMSEIANNTKNTNLLHDYTNLTKKTTDMIYNIEDNCSCKVK